MANWSISTPAGSDLLSLGDDTIRAGKAAIQEALRAGAVAGDDIEGVEAIFPGASPSTAPVYRYRGLKGTTAARPTAGQYGLYYDTTRNVLQRDNGTSWDDIGQNVIPSGTKMVFYQSSAPVGWTAVAVNDKFLRVVTTGGSGGSTGGTVAASTSLAHTHNVNSHTHSIPQVPLAYETVGSATIGSPPTLGVAITSADSDGGYMQSGQAGSSTVRRHFNRLSSGTSSGGATSTTDSQLGVFAYADVVVASKD